MGSGAGALIAHGQPFVVVLARARAEEHHEDRKQRGIWLKHHKQALAALCKAVISVEPDAVRRAALLAQSMLAEKAFGVPMRTVCTEERPPTRQARPADLQDLAIPPRVLSRPFAVRQRRPRTRSSLR